MLLIILIIMCVTLFVLFYNVKSSMKNYWKKQNIVQVDGVLLKFMSRNKSLPEIYKQIYEDHPLESSVGTFLGTRPVLVLKDLDIIQEVLATKFQDFSSRGLIFNSNDLLADNILFIDEYQRWKILRHKLSPVFTSKKLKNMFYIMERCARDFVEFVLECQQAKDRPFDALRTYTTASITASIFGIDTQTKNTMDSPFTDMAKKAMNSTLTFNSKFAISNFSPKLYNWLKIKIFGEHEKFFIGVIRNVLETRRNNDRDRHDFIHTCKELQKEGIMHDAVTGYKLEPTDEVMAAQAFFFFVAGTDTSAHTMLFSLLELANNQHILQKVHKEIDCVFESCNDKITYDELEKMQYLDMVTSEAARMYPTIGTLQRKCTKETTLSNGQIKMEKDTIVIVPVYAIHRDEKYFPDPDVFDPERFSPENISRIPKFAYLPFGEGNRVCIGARFAKLQVKVGLAWLLRRFTLKEKSYNANFEPSFFALRDPDARFDIIPRNIC